MPEMLKTRQHISCEEKSVCVVQTSFKMHTSFLPVDKVLLFSLLLQHLAAEFWELVETVKLIMHMISLKS